MKNSVVVITGGNGGIGNIVVSKLLKEKSKVIVLDINESDNLNIKNNLDYEFIKTDVIDYMQLKNVHDIIKNKYNHIDYLISMAGVNMSSEVGGIKTITFEDIDKSIKLNLNAHIYLVKSMLDLLEVPNNDMDKPKSIVLISSINAISTYGLPAYSAAKSGLYGFMRSIVNELGESKIRINTISLGTVPHINEETKGNEYFENYMKDLPIKKFVRPTDVADTIYSLLEITTCINGQNIVLDMGQSL